jgi:L-ribulose-5-phosphate 3-epimerase UlaE
VSWDNDVQMELRAGQGHIVATVITFGISGLPLR